MITLFLFQLSKVKAHRLFILLHPCFVGLALGEEIALHNFACCLCCYSSYPRNAGSYRLIVVGEGVSAEVENIL